MEKLTRRFVLKSTAGLMALLIWYRPSNALAAKADSSSNFLQLSQFLTGRNKLSPTIASRAYAALTSEDSAFAEKANRLYDVIQKEKFADMSQFPTLIKRYPDLQPVAMKIISAWYLGYTGTPAMLSMKDDAQYVSYEDALMYEPTIDATVIPTFSRGHTNYWVNFPSNLTKD